MSENLPCDLFSRIFAFYSKKVFAYLSSLLRLIVDSRSSEFFESWRETSFENKTGGSIVQLRMDDD